MNKVCIITNYHSTVNYGALLQAYALNYTINQISGVMCLTLDLCVDKSDGTKLKRYFDKFKRLKFKELISSFLIDLRKVLVLNKINQRREAIKSFKDSIPHTTTVTIKDYEKLVKDFDSFVCGSDQIWRPTDENKLIKPYWLSGIENDKLKIAYAASMGIKTFSAELIPEVTKYISDINAVSVREMSTERYLRNITGREDILTVIDPVFLLKREQWDHIAVEQTPSDPYILVYMIYGTNQLLKSITEFARKINMKIYAFPYMARYYKKRDRKFGDYRDFDSTPNRFIGLIKNASYVFTDSFHATAFSIIYHKTFFVSKANEKAITRIEDLLKTLNLSNLLIPGDGLQPIEYMKDILVDWQYVDTKIEKERAFGMNFLNKYLNSGGS